MSNPGLDNFYEAPDADDLDPVTCCHLCLDEGYRVAALSREKCYCVTSESCSSGHRGLDFITLDHTAGRSCGPDEAALYRTRAPYVHNISLAPLTDRVHAGIPFILEVSGYLAAPPCQLSGMPSLAGKDLSSVVIEFNARNPKGQSSHDVTVLDDGFFTVSTDCTLGTPGMHQIEVTVSNPLSRLTSSLRLAALQPPPEGLEVSLVPGPQGTPPCLPYLPYPAQGTQTHATETAYLGDPLTLRASVAGRGRAEFHWSFSGGGGRGGTEVWAGHRSSADCLPPPGYLSSSVSQTFETEGIHTVMVNASNTQGWVQETVSIIVVRRVVSNLSLASASGHQLIRGQNVSVDLELFTTVRQRLLLLNLTLTAVVNHSPSCDPEHDLTHNPAQRNEQTQTHGQDCSPALLPAFSHTLSLASGLQPPGPVQLTYGQSSCILRLRLHYRLPPTVGQYRLSASVFSLTDPALEPLSAALTRPLEVYDHIRALSLTGPWREVVRSGSELNFTVMSLGDRLGSKVVWSIVMGNSTVVNRTTEDWNLTVSLPMAGQYQLTVKAFNPISWASLHRPFLVQDPVGGLVLNVPSVVTVNDPTTMSFTIVAGSNVHVVAVANATVLYHNPSYTTGVEVNVDVLFDLTGTVEVVVRAENLVSSENRTVTVYVQPVGERSRVVEADVTQPPVGSSRSSTTVNGVPAVRIYTDKQAYPTDTDITFQAQAVDQGPLEFLWHFGDSRPIRTSSRTITKRYRTPDRYNVVVVLFNGLSRVTSEGLPVVVERAVRANRLVHQTSALQNHTVGFSCRVNAGTNLVYRWNFGDGTSRTGQNREHHAFHRTGEFTVEVTVSNLVSSASLTGRIFVVDRPCKPPPVKNMGPLKIQVRRYEEVFLGVSYEAGVECDISLGLQYRWAVYDSSGRALPLPLVDTHRQSVTLPSHLLPYGAYTAVARVAIVGSVVYSNYSVRVEVVPTPPVAFILGGTNVFLSNRNSSALSLNGQSSYDPDHPSNPLSYTWTCKPISAIDGSCFDQSVPTSSSPVLVVPAGSLKRDFDQFRFTLTVSSEGRSASSETFVTVTPNLLRRVLVFCAQCRGGWVNWDQLFSVTAVCESCGPAPSDITYTWALYRVNASSKVMDAPFCRAVDPSLPAAIIGGSPVPLPPPSETPRPRPPGGPATPSPSTRLPEAPQPPTPLTQTPVFFTEDSPNLWSPSELQDQSQTSSDVTSSSLTNTAVTSPGPTSTGSVQTTSPTLPSSATARLPPLPPPLQEESQSAGGHPWKRRSVEAQGADGEALSGSSRRSSAPFTTTLAPPQPDLEASSTLSPLKEFDPSEPHYPFYELSPVALDDDSFPYSAPIGQTDNVSEFPSEADLPPDSDFPFPVQERDDGESSASHPREMFTSGMTGPLFGSAEDGVDPSGASAPDYNFPFLGIEEGDPGVSGGRPTGVDSSSSGPGPGPASPSLGEDEGSNLMESSPSLVVPQTTLLDLHRERVETAVFESYTYTGIASPVVSFLPFSLSAGSRYMLEVTANSHDAVLGRTQLFLATNPAPRGVSCQVQPSSGVEIHTHFAIFCTSGKEDLLYEYSYSVGHSPPKTLYQGRDFQYYFHLPAGDPHDDYKVTIYTEIMSSSGTGTRTRTRPCPVAVRVLPRFLRSTSSSSDPDLELFESGLRNLSALVQLGSSVDVRNYVTLLSSALNKLSLDPRADTHTQTRTRSALISAACELDIINQGSLINNICILKDLTQVTQQVTVDSARRVVGHVQSISQMFREPSSPEALVLDRWTVTALVSLLSHSLQATATNDDVTADAREHVQTTTEQAMLLVTESLQTTAELMLKYLLSSQAERCRVSSGVLDLQSAQHPQGVPALLRGGAATFFLPGSLDWIISGRRGGVEVGRRRPCVLSLLTGFTQNPDHWTSSPALITGPVVDLSLYNCSTRREISIRSLSQPISIEFHRTPGNRSSEHALLRGQINYHSFHITQQHLRQAIRVAVDFTQPPNRTFPVMILFRMFEKPTPSLYHLHRIYQWEETNTHILLPPSYLNAAGRGFVALLSAEHGSSPAHRRQGGPVRYTLTLETTQCLSRDPRLGWTPQGCSTQLGLQANKVNCSCDHLGMLVVVCQQIPNRFDSTDVLSQFHSPPRELSVVCVLVVCVFLYALALVPCQRADTVSERDQEVHVLPDNAPSDRHLYAVTVHTGLRSPPRMSAKVHIVLYGEDAASQTKELHVPDCTLFRRNSRNTFILSTPYSLGSLWGVHLWHDNSGPSPSWYLTQVEVVEGRGCGRSWLFLGPCWLAVDESDGCVERRLKVCTEGLGFTKLLYLNLSDYLSDLHLWASVLARPPASAHTHAQRLSVCLLLLLGYMWVNAVIISELEDWFTLELGLFDVSAVSLRTGVFSALAVLPVVTLVSFLFRGRGVRQKRSEVKEDRSRAADIYSVEADALGVNDCGFESHLSWDRLQQWAQEAWRETYEGHSPSLASKDLVAHEKEGHLVIKEEGHLVIKEEGHLVIKEEGPLVIKEEGHLVIEEEGPLVTGEKAGFEDSFSNYNNLLSNSVPNGVSVRPEAGHCCDKGGPSGKPASSPLSRHLGLRIRALSRWRHLIAWVTCLLLCLTCLVLTAVLGTRFSSSQTLLWIHSVFFSILSCVFLIQPAVIFIVAVIVSFWNRKNPDFHSFSGVNSSEIEGLKLRSQDGADPPGCLQHSSPHHYKEKSCYFDQVLAARQRARYLRLVRPPSPAELRGSGRRKRREALVHKTLRTGLLHVAMLLLLLCVTFNTLPRDQYHLNTAVTAQFTRDTHNPFLLVQTHEEWWNWSMTSLLDGLYWDTWYNNAPAFSKAGAVRGACVLIGQPILRKMEVPKPSGCQVPSVLAGLFPDCHNSSGASDWPTQRSAKASPLVIGPQLCGRLGCHSGHGTQIGLGRTRSEAVTRLASLRSEGWLDRRTLAVAVQATFYSPATGLFSGVTLLTESTAGALLPSASVQSTRVYHRPTVWDYVTMGCQLLLLLLTLLQLFLQISRAGQKGMLGYWTCPSNWLEVSIVLMTLVYYVHYVYQSTVTLEVIDLLQRHNFKEYVDVSCLCAWAQKTCVLRGVLLFLLLMKSVCVLRLSRTMATPVSLLRLTLSRLLWPMLSGAVLLVALSSVGGLLFTRGSRLFGPLHALLSPSRGGAGLPRTPPLSHAPASLAGSLYRGALSLAGTLLWSALVTGLVSSLVKAAKKAGRRRGLLTLPEVAICVRERMSAFIGRHKRRCADSHAHSRNYYLEEFEGLVDELLFRLNAFSNSLHHTLPLKDHHHREDSTLLSSPRSPSSLGSQCSAVSETPHTRAVTVSDHLNIGRHPKPELEPESLQLLQQGGQRGPGLTPEGALSAGVAMSDCPLPDGGGSRGNPALSDRDFHSSSGEHTLFSCPDMKHLPGARAEGNLPHIQNGTYFMGKLPVVQENQSSHLTITALPEKRAPRRPMSTQLAGVRGPWQSHTAVVEVLVHEIPRTAGLEVQEEEPGTVRQCWD